MYNLLDKILGPLFDEFMFRTIVSPVFEEIKKNADKKTAKYCVSVLRLYKNEEMREVSNCLVKASEDLDCSKKVADIFRKYHDNNYPLIAEEFLQYENSHYNLDEMLTDEAYNAIKENPKRIVRVMEAVYLHTRDEIEDFEIVQNIPYETLDKILTTHLFINGVHEKREIEDLQIIAEGFYSELNRAISQETTVAGKNKMIETYLKDCENLVEEHVEDLMVNHNA